MAEADDGRKSGAKHHLNCKDSWGCSCFVNSLVALVICDFISYEFSSDVSSTVAEVVKEALNSVLPDRDEFLEA